MTKAIVKNSFSTVKDLLVSQKTQIEEALPRQLKVENLMHVALTCIRKNEKLLLCNKFSLIGAIVQAAQLGLSCDPVLGQAYLVPYKAECTLIIGYKGMIRLATNSAVVRNIVPRAVYAGDIFEYEYGLNEKLRHIPSEEPGQLTHVYAIAELYDGVKQFIVLNKQKIEAARKASPKGKKNEGPWKDYYDDMAMKTAIRRLFKYIPNSPEMERGVSIDELGEAGIGQGLGDMFMGENELPGETSQPIGIAGVKENLKKRLPKTTSEQTPPKKDKETKKDTDIPVEPEPPVDESFDPRAEALDIAKSMWGKKAKDALDHHCRTNFGADFDELLDEDISRALDYLVSLKQGGEK